MGKPVKISDSQYKALVEILRWRAKDISKDFKELTTVDLNLIAEGIVSQNENGYPAALRITLKFEVSANK